MPTEEETWPWVRAVARVLHDNPAGLRQGRLQTMLMSRLRLVSGPAHEGAPQPVPLGDRARGRAREMVSAALRQGPFGLVAGRWHLDEGVELRETNRLVLERAAAGGERTLLVFDWDGPPTGSRWTNTEADTAILDTLEELDGPSTLDEIHRHILGQLREGERVSLSFLGARLDSLLEAGQVVEVGSRPGRYRLPREAGAALPTDTLELGALVDTVVADTGARHAEAQHRLQQARFVMIDGRVRTPSQLADALHCPMGMAEAILIADPAYIVVEGGYQWGAELQRESPTRGSIDWLTRSIEDLPLERAQHLLGHDNNPEAVLSPAEEEVARLRLVAEQVGVDIAVRGRAGCDERTAQDMIRRVGRAMQDGQGRTAVQVMFVLGPPEEEAPRFLALVESVLMASAGYIYEETQGGPTYRGHYRNPVTAEGVEEELPAEAVEARILGLFEQGDEVLSFGNISDALSHDFGWVGDSELRDALRDLVKAGKVYFLEDRHSGGYRLVVGASFEGKRVSALDRLKDGGLPLE